jgi:adhesin transport system outer membrane protein
MNCDCPLQNEQGKRKVIHGADMKKKLGLTAAAILCFASSAYAESISQAARWAVDYHPDVRVLTANRSAIGEELAAARGLALPGVRVEGNYGAMSTANGGAFGTGDIAIKIKQPLYKGGKIRAEKRRQSARLSSAGNRLADTIDTVALQAIQAYFEVVRSERVLTKSRRNLSRIKSIVHRVRKRVRGGAGNQADLAQAEARLYSANNSLAVAEIQREDAFTLYLTAVGRHPGELEQADLPKHILPRSINQIVDLSRTASPKLAAVRFDAAAADAAIESAKAVFRPQVDLELASGLYGRRALGQNHRQEHSAMVQVSWSLFNGGIDRARLREARFRAEEAHAQIETAELSLERELRLSWNTYLNAPKQVSYLIKQRDTNARLRDLRVKQYDSGLASLISILDAQNETYVSDIQATNVYNSGRFAFYKLLAASGHLGKTLALPGY